jgi:hypothetical protein
VMGVIQAFDSVVEHVLGIGHERLQSAMNHELAQILSDSFAYENIYH